MDVGEAQHVAIVALCAPQYRLHARDQLGEAEGLGHVVVAERESGDLVLGRVLGREEDHGHRHAPVAQPARDGQAVEVGKHHVEDDEVGPEFVDRGHGGTAGGDLAGVEALVAECGGDGVGDRRLVVDDQDAPHVGRALGHYRPPRRRAWGPPQAAVIAIGMLTAST